MCAIEPTKSESIGVLVIFKTLLLSIGTEVGIEVFCALENHLSAREGYNLIWRVSFISAER